MNQVPLKFASDFLLTSCENISIQNFLSNFSEISLNFQNLILKDYLKFIESMRTAASIMNKLMMGKTPAEIIEAIEFFKTASKFNLTGAEEGVRNMLLLTNSKEPTIKEAVINAFKTLYLQSEGSDKQGMASAVSNVTLFKHHVYK